jgi:hypothetical protein
MTLQELWDSRDQSVESAGLTIDFGYLVTGHSLNDEAAINDVAQNTLAQITRNSVVLNRNKIDLRRTGSQEFIATVSYANKEPEEVGDQVISFDTAGGTTKVTQSLETIESYPAPDKVAPDFKGAMNVTHDRIEGTDKLLAGMKFSIRETFDPSVVTLDYVKELSELTTKVNDSDWKGFDAGTVMFLGAKGDGSRSDKASITFDFEMSENLTGHSIGPIDGIEKTGWQYLWVRYEDVDDDDAKQLVKQPTAAYVEKIYEEADFADLGIT